MSQSEVFRPSNGPLLVRGNLSDGLSNSADVFRKERPATQNSTRFGRMSYNSFFTRHNPHPGRVRHIKGQTLNRFTPLYADHLGHEVSFSSKILAIYQCIWPYMYITCTLLEERVPRGTIRVIRTASYLVPLRVPQRTLWEGASWSTLWWGSFGYP